MRLFRKYRKIGFTLIELMLVVSIIGLLAAIAAPKFANMVTKAKESAVRGKMGAFRSALSIYYADNEGFYPKPNVVGSNAIMALIPKYIESVPLIELPNIRAGYHVGGLSNLYNPGPGIIDWTEPGATEFCGWYYPFSGATPVGTLFVNCDHTDSNGRVWSTY